MRSLRCSGDVGFKREVGFGGIGIVVNVEIGRIVVTDSFDHWSVRFIGSTGGWSGAGIGVGGETSIGEEEAGETNGVA